MGIHWRVDLVVHIAGPPRSIRTGRLDEPNRKLIEVRQRARDRLTGSKLHRDFGFRAFGIQHLLFEFEAPVARRNSGKVPGWRVADCAPPGAVEVLLTGLGVSSLEIGDVHPFTSANSSAERAILLSVDKGNQAGNLIIGTIKAWHAFVGASIAHDFANLVPVHILGHEVRSCEIRTTRSALRIAAVTKRTALPEEVSSALVQG